LARSPDDFFALALNDVTESLQDAPARLTLPGRDLPLRLPSAKFSSKSIISNIRMLIFTKLNTCMVINLLTKGKKVGWLK